jgi:WD40 repeat protein
MSAPRAVGPVTAASVLALAVLCGVGLVLGWPRLTDMLDDVARDGPREPDPRWEVDFSPAREKVPWSLITQPVDDRQVLLGKPSGRLETMSVDGTASEPLQPELTTRVMDIATSDDGTTTAAIDLDGNVVVWRGGEELAAGRLDPLTYSGMTVDADGSRFAAVGFSVRVWDLPGVRVASSAARPVPEGGTGMYEESRFLDSRLLTVDPDGMADSWSVDTRRAQLERESCRCYESSAAWSRDGALVAFGTSDGRLVLHDAGTDEILADQTVDVGPGSFVEAQAVLDTRHVLVTTSRTPLAVWSIVDHDLVWEAAPGLDVQHLALSPDQSVVAAVLFDGSFDYSLWTGRIVSR